MKKISFVTMALTFAIIAALAVNGFRAAPPVYAADANKGEITVSGVGSVNVNPDVAYISLGVNTQNVNPKTALEDNNRLIANVIDAIKGMGIAEKDIRTTDFNMYPNYDYSDKSGQRISGYSVNNSVSVVIRDIAIAGDVLGAAADAGANVSGGVQFGLLDNSAAYNEALALAIANASGKAKTIADALGKPIGSPVSVTESLSYYSPYSAGAMNMSVAADAGGVPVQSGKLTVTANVQMVYDYNR